MVWSRISDNRSIADAAFAPACERGISKTDAGAMRRRDFIQIGAAAWPARKLAGATARKKIAALATTFHVRSHADNFITRFLEGYWIDKRHYESPADIVSLYMDQVHPADI